MINEIMCRKKFEPHKCEYVPNNEAVIFVMSIPTLMDKLSSLLQLHRTALRTGMRYEWRDTGRRYRVGPEAKAFNAMVMAKFRYADSYISSSDCMHRFTIIYEQNRTKIQARGQGDNA